MNKNLKKKLSAFIWVLLISIFIFYYMIYQTFISNSKFVITPILGIALIISFIYLLIKRFKEIDSGVEDNLDKY